MQLPTTWLCGGLVLGSVGLAAMSLAHQSGQALGQPVTLALSRAPVGHGSSSDFDRECYQRLRQGAAWLARTGEWGREPDSLARVSLALARTARLTGDRRLAERARHLILMRKSIQPDSLAGAGLLVLAIEELPTPDRDLLQQSERLCALIARQQQEDGRLVHIRGLDDAEGAALYGLGLSARRQRASWKIAVLRRACEHDVSRWRAQPGLALAPGYVPAYAEAYRATGESAFGVAVVEMADWLCGQQYQTVDDRHPEWLGGFPPTTNGTDAVPAPTISSAACAEALAAACRVAQQKGDHARLDRYRRSLIRCLQFVWTLQYTKPEIQRFADWYRPMLDGSFCDSRQDGTPSLRGTEHAVAALAKYLGDVAPMDRSVDMAR